MRPSLIRLAALVFGSLAPTPSPMLADEITAVAITLGSAPGLGGGRYETFPEMPIINDAGKVAFDATLSDATGGSDSGLFRSDAANNAVAIAREGEASGSPGVTLGSVGGQFAMNDQGRVFFPNFLSGAGVTAANNSGLFVGNTSGGFSLQVREGSFVSGRNVTSFGSLRAAGGRFVSTLRTSNAGQPQLEALLSLNSQGANPTMIALQNAFGPITSFGTTTVGDGGEIVMNGRTLRGSSSQLAALFRITSAGTQTLFSQPPFFNALGFRSFGAPDTNGVVAFNGSETFLASNPQQTRSAAFRDGVNAATQGDPAPGGGAFSTVGTVDINRLGEIAFVSG